MSEGEGYHNKEDVQARKCRDSAELATLKSISGETEGKSRGDERRVGS